jgi:hypothetical protein
MYLDKGMGPGGDPETLTAYYSRCSYLRSSDLRILDVQARQEASHVERGES